jgi:tetratricopeptide (TPR) repeat protein
MTSTGSAVSQLHLLRGQAYYMLGRFDRAAIDLEAADDPLDVPAAAAYLAGIAIASGNRKEAGAWEEKCLTEAMRELDGGSGLVAAAHVRTETGAREWPVAQTAMELMRRNKGILEKTHMPYWAMGVLTARTSLDSAGQMFRGASNGKPPFPREWPDASFCVDYADMLAASGLRGRAADLLAAYNTLDEWSESIPATRSATEGLRWLYMDTYGNKIDQRGD